jgi:hypothetical protein
MPPRKPDAVHTGEEIVVAVFVVGTLLIILGLFVWAAVKDGEEDKALQKRLRIRRRTRLGR